MAAAVRTHNELKGSLEIDRAHASACDTLRAARSAARKTGETYLAIRRSARSRLVGRAQEAAGTCPQHHRVDPSSDA